MTKAQFLITVGLLIAAGLIAAAASTSPERLRYALQIPFVKGSLVGAAVAIKVDLDAFRSFKTFDEAATYSWSTALLHAYQGALSGAGLDSFFRSVTA